MERAAAYLLDDGRRPDIMVDVFCFPRLPFHVEDARGSIKVDLTVPEGSHLEGQPVLGMTFCVNRRKDIARLAGNAVLRGEYTNLRTEMIFEKFRKVATSKFPSQFQKVATSKDNPFWA